MVLSLLHLLGATGTVMFDEKADRDPDFVISSYTQGDDTYHEWTQILMYRQENQVSQIRIGPHLHYSQISGASLVYLPNSTNRTLSTYFFI